MSKSTTNEASKPAKVYKKTRGEHFKDILIAVLITAIIAFGLGVKVQANRNAEITKAVSQAVTPTATAAEASTKK